MGRTVDSQEKSREKLLTYGLLFLGIFLLMAAIALVFPALEYEFRQGERGEVQQATTGPDLKYEHLTPQEQRVVDGALDGESYVLKTSSPLPGDPQYSLEPRQLQVTKQGTTHMFIYQTVFPAESPMGMGTIALAVSGLLAIAEAVRRDLFRDSLPW